jgi:hypothetical protein
MFVKYWEQPLLMHLNKLKKNYELIIFTSLPRDFIKRIFAKTPKIEELFSQVLCGEEQTIQEDFKVKDISLLLHNRTLEDIFVVEPNADQVHAECVASINPEPYDGKILYAQLEALIVSLKRSRNS